MSSSNPLFEYVPLEMKPFNLPLWKKILFRRLRNPAFIVGERFEIEFKFKNLQIDPFPGCDVSINVEWPNSGLSDYYKFQIPEILGNEETEPFRFNFGLIEAGYGLIKLRLEQGLVGINIKVGNVITPFIERHVESVFAQDSEEFYQLWAMVLATVGLFYILVKDVINFFLSWLLSLKSNG